MSRPQYAFLIGVLLVWFTWAAGWWVLVAVIVGLIGLAIVQAVDGGVDLPEVMERFKSAVPKKSS